MAVQHPSALGQSSRGMWGLVGGWRVIQYLPDSSSRCQCLDIVPKWVMLYKVIWINGRVPTKWEVSWWTSRCFWASTVWSQSMQKAMIFLSHLVDKWPHTTAGNLFLWKQQWVLNELGSKEMEGKIVCRDHRDLYSTPVSWIWISCLQLVSDWKKIRTGRHLSSPEIKVFLQNKYLFHFHICDLKCPRKNILKTLSCPGKKKHRTGAFRERWSAKNINEFMWHYLIATA